MVMRGFGRFCQGNADICWVAAPVLRAGVGYPPFLAGRSLLNCPNAGGAFSWIDLNFRPDEQARRRCPGRQTGRIDELLGTRCHAQSLGGSCGTIGCALHGRMINSVTAKKRISGFRRNQDSPAKRIC